MRQLEGLFNDRTLSPLPLLALIVSAMLLLVACGDEGAGLSPAEVQEVAGEELARISTPAQSEPGLTDDGVERIARAATASIPPRSAPAEYTKWELTEGEARCLQSLLPYNVLLSREEAESIRNCTSKSSTMLLTYLHRDTWLEAMRDYEYITCVTNNGGMSGQFFEKSMSQEEDETTRLAWALATRAAFTLAWTSCIDDGQFYTLGLGEKQQRTTECVIQATESGLELVRILFLGQPVKAVSRFEDAVGACSGEIPPTTPTPEPPVPALRLSQEEVTCLKALDAPDQLLSWDQAPPTREWILKMRDCLQADSQKLLTYTIDDGSAREFRDNMSEEAISCSRGIPFASFGFFPQMYAEDAELEWMLALLAATTLGMAKCFSEEHLAALGAGPDEQAALRCILMETRRGAELVAIMLGGSAPEALAKFDEAHRHCRQWSGR